MDVVRDFGLLEDAWLPMPQALPAPGQAARWSAAPALDHLHKAWGGFCQPSATLQKVQYDETDLIAGIVFRKSWLMICLYLSLARLGKQLAELELCRQDTFQASRDSKDGQQYLQYSLDVLLSRSQDAVETMQDLSSEMGYMDGANNELTSVGSSQQFNALGHDPQARLQLQNAMPVGAYMQTWSTEIMHGADSEMKATLAGIRQSLGLMQPRRGSVGSESVALGSLLDNGPSLGF